MDVDVPVRTAYDQWTQFEEFPRFMEGVKTVRQLDDTHLEWTAEVAGVAKHWKAEITEQTPDQRIAWQATDGAQNAGVVTFHRLDDREDAGDPPAGRRARRAGRDGRRRARLRPAPGQGRPRALQGVHRGARRRRPAPGAGRSTSPTSPASPGAALHVPCKVRSGRGRATVMPARRHWSRGSRATGGPGATLPTPVRWPGSPAPRPTVRPAQDCHAVARSEAAARTGSATRRPVWSRRHIERLIRGALVTGRHPFSHGRPGPLPGPSVAFRPPDRSEPRRPRT